MYYNVDIIIFQFQIFKLMWSLFVNRFENLAAGKYPLGLHNVERPGKGNKKREIRKAVKQLMLDEHRMIHDNIDSEDSCDKTTKDVKENQKKDKTKTKKSFNWEVSDSESNVSNNKSVSKCSWDVSDTIPEEKNKPYKRKNIEEKDTSDLDSAVKKMKVSTFTVSDSKENSFSSPVASTPKRVNENSVLKKLTNNSYNKCDSTQTPTNNSSLNQQNRVAKKTKKSKVNKNESVNNSIIEKGNNSQKGKKLPIKKKSSINMPNTSSTKQQENDQEESTNIQLNTATDRNNGWGGEWEPSKDVEYEIFIPNKKYVEKRKSLGLSYPLPEFFQKSCEKVTPVNKLKVS